MVTELYKDKEDALGISFEFVGRVPSLSQNVSKSGLVCRTARKVEEMTILDIRFVLPPIKNYVTPENWVECSGVVVHCEKTGADTATLPYEIAIFFDRISEKDRKLLADYITEKA